MKRFTRLRRLRGAGIAALLAAALAAAAGSAMAEDNPPPASSSPPPVAVPHLPTQPPPADKPGFLHQLGVWWNDSITFFDRGFKDTRGAFEDIGKKSGSTAKDAAKGAAAVTEDAMKKTFDVSKDAADTIAKLPNTRVIDTHATCAPAPNGAPDCAAAAVAACRAKGFGGGKPLDVRTAENCDARETWRPGHTPGKGECPIESWITRVVCQ